MLKIGERFIPHPNLKRVYRVYLMLAAVPMFIASLLPIWAVSTFEPEVWRFSWGYTFIPLIVVVFIVGFIAYWIPKYYHSISYTLTEDEVVVERGVWWKMKHLVPYARVMSVDIIQGPISRFFGLGSIHVHTAGYTGPAGGTSGPGTRGAEACIWGVQNFVEIRNIIIGFVRGKPLFAAPAADISLQILEELKKIREALEEKSQKNS